MGAEKTADDWSIRAGAGDGMVRGRTAVAAVRAHGAVGASGGCGWYGRCAGRRGGCGAVLSAPSKKTRLPSAALFAIFI